MIEPDYEDGYREGGNSLAADWVFALGHYCDLPDDVDDESPRSVAEYIGRLQAHEAAVRVALGGASYQLGERVLAALDDSSSPRITSPRPDSLPTPHNPRGDR